MTIAKLAASVLSTLVLFVGAVAVAEDPATAGSTDTTTTICVIGSTDALGTSCTISADGDVLAGAYLVPGENYITVDYSSTDLVVAGDEVLAASSHPDNPGIN